MSACDDSTGDVGDATGTFEDAGIGAAPASVGAGATGIIGTTANEMIATVL